MGFLSSLQGLLISLGLGTENVLSLLDPLVATDASFVVLDGVVDLVLRLAVETGQLLVGEDAQRVEFLFAVRTDALDGLQVIGVLLGRLTDALEIKRLLSLLDAVHRFLLFRLCFVLVRHDGDFPLEVHAGLAQLDAAGVGVAFVGGEFSVVELEVDDDLSVLSDGQLTGTFHGESRLVHREATVVVLVVEVEHVDLDIAHVGDGDLFHRGFHGSGLQRTDRSEDERVVLGPCTGREVRFSEGVLGLGTVRQHHQQTVASVAPKQQRDDQEQQQQQQAGEAPHPVGAVLLRTVATAFQTNGKPRLRAGISVHGVRTAGRFLSIGKAVVVVVGVFGQIAYIAFGQLVRQAVVVRVVEHGQRKGERLAVDRVVGPHGQVDRGAGVQRRAADATVEGSVSSRAHAERQAFWQFAFEFPRDHFTAAVDERDERFHRAVHEEVHVLRGVLQRERQVKVRVKRIANAVAVRIGRHARSVHRARSAARKFVGIRPGIIVVVQVLHQRGLAR